MVTFQNPRDRYKDLTTNELVVLLSEGGLTDEATKALHCRKVSACTQVRPPGHPWQIVSGQDL